MVAATNDTWARAESTRTSIHDQYVDESWGQLGTPEDDPLAISNCHELPPVSFYLDGLAADDDTEPIAAPVVGRVKHLDEERLDIGTPGFRTALASLCYHLPASIDLRPLVGRKVRLVVGAVQSPTTRGRLLTIHDDREGVWLVAHHGSNPLWQNVDGVDLSVAAWPELGGLLVVGPPGQTCVVEPGASTRIRCGASRYVVELVSLERGAAAYVIADERLWH
jgi:hypothetical protein